MTSGSKVRAFGRVCFFEALAHGSVIRVLPLAELGRRLAGEAFDVVPCFRYTLASSE